MLWAMADVKAKFGGRMRANVTYGFEGRGGEG